MKLIDIMNVGVIGPNISVNEKSESKGIFAKRTIDNRVKKITKGVVGAVKIDLDYIEENIKDGGLEEAKDYCRYAIDRLSQLQKVLKRVK